MALTDATSILLDGLCFGEGPRWHDGQLYFSDIHAHWVMTVDAAGTPTRVAEVANAPSGLGWLPDGRLLVVSMDDSRLLRLEVTTLIEHADLAPLGRGVCNDMVVDARGYAYVGGMGFGFARGEEYRPGAIIMITPTGEARVVAEDLLFPNGSVVTSDGATLIVAETRAARLTAFDLLPDGGLEHRRVWAAVDGTTPDGMCLDAEGAVWVASPMSGEVLRVHEGGRVSDRLRPSRRPYACTLGGPDGRTLFVFTAESHSPTKVRALRSGRLETTRVDVPAGGSP
jgi:sugar lactone lactonase YvrE